LQERRKWDTGWKKKDFAKIRLPGNKEIMILQVAIRRWRNELRQETIWRTKEREAEAYRLQGTKRLQQDKGFQAKKVTAGYKLQGRKEVTAGYRLQRRNEVTSGYRLQRRNEVTSGYRLQGTKEVTWGYRF
jgi:hypothetical protein